MESCSEVTCANTRHMPHITRLLHSVLHAHADWAHPAPSPPQPHFITHLQHHRLKELPWVLQPLKGILPGVELPHCGNRPSTLPNIISRKQCGWSSALSHRQPVMEQQPTECTVACSCRQAGEAKQEQGKVVTPQSSLPHDSLIMPRAYTSAACRQHKKQHRNSAAR